MSTIRRSYNHNAGSRGRLPSGYSKTTKKAIQYLARIALRLDIDSSTFFSSLVDAWENTESICDKLVIRCRKKTKDSATFLFTKERQALAQLTVPEGILKERNPIKRYIDALPPEAFSPKELDRKNLTIIDLKQRMKHVNIKARVVETPEPKLVFTRFGTEAYVSNVLLADTTGTIRLSLWNNQINDVSVDDVIKIENGNVASFRGRHQLKIGRTGTLNVIEGEDFPSLLNLSYYTA
jgi:replication factor A1